MKLTRRDWLSLAFALSARTARADGANVLTVRELHLPGATKFGSTCWLLRPTRVEPERPLPVVVLFHGLGETSREALGVRAWYDRYGLPEAYARLASGEVRRTLPRERYLSDSRLREINAELARAPFQDVAIVCPFTPNVWKYPSPSAILDEYAEYIEHSVLPSVREAMPTASGTRHLGVDGVSLGGYVALEVFLRKPELFGVVGSVQGAFSVALAERYAPRFAAVLNEHGPRDLHLTTSSEDPFRAGSERLAERLQECGIRATLSVLPGPHDQRFLREIGTLEMLLFQARALGPP